MRPPWTAELKQESMKTVSRVRRIGIDVPKDWLEAALHLYSLAARAVPGGHLSDGGHMP